MNITSIVKANFALIVVRSFVEDVTYDVKDKIPILDGVLRMKASLPNSKERESVKGICVDVSISPSNQTMSISQEAYFCGTESDLIANYPVNMFKEIPAIGNRNYYGQDITKVNNSSSLIFSLPVASMNLKGKHKSLVDLLIENAQIVLEEVLDDYRNTKNMSYRKIVNSNTPVNRANNVLSRYPLTLQKIAIENEHYFLFEIAK